LEESEGRTSIGKIFEGVGGGERVLPYLYGSCEKISEVKGRKYQYLTKRKRKQKECKKKKKGTFFGYCVPCTMNSERKMRSVLG